MSKNYVKEYNGHKVPEGATHYNDDFKAFYKTIPSEGRVYFSAKENDWLWVSGSAIGFKESIEIPEEPTQEWVDGLPSAGTECEATWLEMPDGGGNDFCDVVIKGIYGDEVWFSKVNGVDGYSEVVKITSCEFRPLKTQEQKDREAFHMAVIDACMGIHKEDFNIDEIAGALYHADFKSPEGE